MNPAQRAAKVRHTLQRFQQGYQTSFAGQPRISRNPSQLDAWVTQIRALLPQIQLLPQALKTELMPLAQSRVSLYTKEAIAIREMHDLNTPSQVAYQLIEWINLCHDRYQRHFAGMSRNTRDTHLLSELMIELQVWKNQTEALLDEQAKELHPTAQKDLTARLKQLIESLDMYESERKAIAQSRSQGDLDQRGDLFAHLANHYFSIYRAQFQGHSRRSRRLSTLERVIMNLQHIKEEMGTLKKAGLKTESHLRNIEIVAEKLGGYSTEAKEIEGVQNRMSFEEWVSELFMEVDQISQDYRDSFADRARASCDPELLCHLCDRLYDAVYQLRPFIQPSPDAKERARLQLALDHLRLYHRELGLVKKAIDDQQEEEKIIH